MGRPKLIDDAYYNLLKKIFPEDKTRRGTINRYYICVAQEALSKIEFDNKAFLLDKQRDFLNYTLLVELGRLRKNDDIIEIAKYICKRALTEKHKIKEWELILKSIRLWGRII